MRVLQKPRVNNIGNNKRKLLVALGTLLTVGILSSCKDQAETPANKASIERLRKRGVIWPDDEVTRLNGCTHELMPKVECRIKEDQCLQQQKAKKCTRIFLECRDEKIAESESQGKTILKVIGSAVAVIILVFARSFLGRRKD